MMRVQLPSLTQIIYFTVYRGVYSIPDVLVLTRILSPDDLPPLTDTNTHVYVLT